MIRSKNNNSHHPVQINYLILIFIMTISLSSAAFGAEHVYEFVSDSAVSYIELPHQNIFTGSVKIQSGLITNESIDRIDYSRGVIFLNDILMPDYHVTISYEYLSYKLPDYVFIRKLESENQSDPVLVNIDDPLKPKQSKRVVGSSFKLSGSKSISVSAGNTQDLDLNQRLNLRISGEPIKGLMVVGSLSDKAQPQAGGLSSALEDIESISLTATARNFEVELGDINYKNQWGGIASFSKKLKGVDADFNAGNFNAQATVSSLKGRYNSVTFFAIDGVSGPYSLKSQTGNRTSIVGGTEKVYLDGRLLKQGASEDYLIDYALGEITFNPRISLNSRTRIVVDYEYLDQSYRRNFYSAEMDYNLFSEKLNISAGYMELSDSRNNPVDFVFSSEDQDILSSSGDNQSNSVRDGGVFVGEGNGNYSLEIDELGNSYYNFVGDSLGEYNVRFSRVDRNEGDYSYLGGGRYLYKGKNLGNYLPFEYLSLPTVSRAVYMGSNLKFGNHVDLQLKLSGSDNDQNSFSDIDDSDNNGFMGEAKMLFDPIDSATNNKTIRKARTRLYLKTQERNFYLPGRSEIPELNRKWALGTDSISDRTDQYELGQDLNLFEIFNLNAELGHLEDGNKISSDRNSININIKPQQLINLNFNRADRIAKFDSDTVGGRIYQNHATASLKSNDLNLTTGWEDEKDSRVISFDSSPSIKFDRYFSEIKYSGARISLSSRNQSRLVETWLDEYRDWEISSGLNRALFNGSLNIEAEVTRRKIEYAGDSLPDFSETRSLSKFSFRGPANIFSGYFSYRLNRQLISRLARNFIKVEEGQGNYRLEDSVYVRDDFGDYIAIDELIEAGDAGLSSEKSMSLKLDLRKILPGLKKINQLYTETNLNLEEQGAGDYRLNLLYSLPFWNVYPDDELFFKQDFRQIISLSTRDGHLVSVGFEENHTRDNIRDLKSERYRRLIYERIYFAFSKTFNLKLEHRFKREKEASGYYGAADFNEHEIFAELLFYSGKNFELNIKPRYLTDRSKSDDLRVTLVGGQVSPAVSFAGKGRITAELSYLNVKEIDDRFIPYQYASGNRPGDNLKWGAGINYKYNKYITARLKYTADKVPGLSARHKVSLSMKASF